MTTIRPTTSSDAPLLTHWWNDGIIMAHAGFPRGLGITEARVRELLSSDDPVALRFMILHHDNAVGEMSGRKTGDDGWDLGIKVCEPSIPGKGIGSIAFSAMMEWLSIHYGAQSFEVSVNPENDGAIRFYQRLGFSNDYRPVGSWKDQDGNDRTSIVLSMKMATP